MEIILGWRVRLTLIENNIFIHLNRKLVESELALDRKDKLITINKADIVQDKAISRLGRHFSTSWKLTTRLTTRLLKATRQYQVRSHIQLTRRSSGKYLYTRGSLVPEAVTDIAM